MYKELVLSFSLFLCGIIGCSQDRVDPIVIEEFQFFAHPVHRNSTWETPITTYNESIYAVFLDPDLKITVVKKVKGEDAQSVIVSDFSAKNDLHHTFSIGIDAEGYIHIIGNQHNLPSNAQSGDPHIGNFWRYWVSKNPEDISDWEFIDDGSSRSIPGDALAQPSYVKFFRSPNGSLFTAFRANAGLKDVGDGGPGKYGAYVARYENNTKTWKLLGATTEYEGITSRELWAFEYSGVNATVYQPIQPDIFIGENGNIHMVTAINHDSTSRSGPDTGAQDGWRSGTAVLYGFSEDNGETWKKADGSVLTLPNTIENGDVAYLTRPGKIHNTLRVGAMPDGSPYILFVVSSDRFLTYWNGSEWVEPIQLGYASNNMFIDEEGVITFNKENTLTRVRTEGSGQGLKSNEYIFKDLSMDTDSKFDRDVRDKFIVRMLNYSNTSPMTATCVTFNFDPDAVITPPDTVITPPDTVITSVLDVDGIDFKIYPNPVSGNYLTLSGEELPKGGHYQILDLYGGVIRRRKKINAEDTRINIESLPVGSYFLSVYSEKGGRHNFKFIKQ